MNTSKGTVRAGANLILILALAGLLAAAFLALVVTPAEAARTPIVQAATTTGVNRYEQNDSRFVYAGTWYTYLGSSYSGGSARYSANSPSSVTITFNGTTLNWIGRKAANAGIAKVRVDGGTAAYVDLYSPSTVYQQKLWGAGTLHSGTHTVTISWTGIRNRASSGVNVNIDAVDVVGTLTDTQAPTTSTTQAPTTTTAPPSTTTTAAPSTTTTTKATTTTTLPSGTGTTVEALAYCYGDGVRDDTANMARALAACQPGDTLHFAGGHTYLGDVECVEGVNISGDGSTSWIKGTVRPKNNQDFTNLKIGASGLAFGYSGGNNVTYGIRCLDVTFAGRVQFQAGEPTWDGSLHDALFQGCTFLPPTSGNNVTLYAYGTKATNTHYNIDFRDCVWTSSPRMNVEITCWGGPAENFAYPWYNINFYDCDFGPSAGQNLSICGRRAGYWAAPYSGGYQCGYGTMSGCYMEDAGVNPPSGTNRMAIEAMMLHSYTFTNNVIGRNRDGEVTGTHLEHFIETGVDDLEHKTNAGYDNEMYNVITNNVFDGSGSSISTFVIKGGHNTFSGNTVIQQVCQGFTNANDCTIENNEFRTVNADGTLSTTRYALWIADADDMLVKGNTFKSKNSHTTIVSNDYIAPTGPATNIQFANNTFVKDASDNPLEIVTGSSATVTGSTYLIAP